MLYSVHAEVQLVSSAAEPCRLDFSFLHDAAEGGGRIHQLPLSYSLRASGCQDNHDPSLAYGSVECEPRCLKFGYVQ